MGNSIRGARPLREWKRLAEDPQSALGQRLAEIYGSPDDAARPLDDLRRAIGEFGSDYGDAENVVIVRAPGRVNMFGMHIDHRGGAVNPISINEIFVIAQPRDDDLVVARDVEADQFGPESFRIGECLPKGLKIDDWDSWCHDELEKRKDDPSVTWSNYLRAGALYLQHLHTDANGAFCPALRGMNIVCCGTVPRAAGLSSSSALVVGMAEACVRINNLEIQRDDLVEICGYAEWYVGTRGGNGDHAAIIFGEAGAISHMTCFPFSVSRAPFPKGYSVVLANSLIEAKKQSGARNAFNSRVASYEFGLMLAKKNFPRHAPKLERLRDLNPRTLGVDEAEVYRILLSLPQTADREKLLELLPEKRDELRHAFRSHEEPKEGYKIRQVCVYGVSECLRSEMTVKFLREGDIEGFGRLISISHNGDRVTCLNGGSRQPYDCSYPDERILALIADLESGDPRRAERARLWRQPGGYECSRDETDVLVDAAMSVSGVLGARIVGAGLGGSVLALVRENRVRALRDRLAEAYYAPRNLAADVRVVKPVAGSGVLDLDAREPDGAALDIR